MDTSIGPGIGPAATPAALSLPPPPSSLPANPATFGGDQGFVGASMSAAPQASTNMYSLAPGQAQPVVLPPLHYQGLASSQPFGYTPAPPGMHPSRAAAMAGTVRSADEMLDGDSSGGPSMKRARVGRMPDGSFYPEETWMSHHPVSSSCKR